MRHPIVIPLFTAVFFALACGALEPTVATDIKVDGKPFTPSRCFSGETRGFSGIELEDAGGTRLRLAHRDDGMLDVHWLPAGKAEGEALGACASGAFSPGALTVNDVKGLSGSAWIDCAESPMSVTGTVSVDNCSTYLF